MTIDEVIAYAREKADKNSVCCDCTSIKDCKTCEQEHKYEQLAEWLEELKAIKSDGFTDNLLNMGFTKGYSKAIDDFANWLVEQGVLGNRCISDGEITDYGKVYAKKYKEQLKEQKNEQ